jgi:hypothetical protein
VPTTTIGAARSHYDHRILLTDLIRSWPAERVDLVVEQGMLRLACGTREAAMKGSMLSNSLPKENTDARLGRV